MILTEIKKYLSAKKTANLQELSSHFKRDPEMMRILLQHWIRKGKVCIAENPAGCGTRCVQCKPQYAQVYMWTFQT